MRGGGGGGEGGGGERGGRGEGGGEGGVATVFYKQPIFKQQIVPHFTIRGLSHQSHIIANLQLIWLFGSVHGYSCEK